MVHSMFDWLTTWSQAYDIIFQEFLLRPWVENLVPMCSWLTRTIYIPASSFLVLALKLMTNEICKSI